MKIHNIFFLVQGAMAFILLGCSRPIVPGRPATSVHQAENTSSSTRVFTDRSNAFLQGNTRGARLAHTPPVIDFGVVSIEAQKYGINYGAWGHVVRGPDGSYYFGFGNHSLATGGDNGALLASYAPATKRTSILLFSKDLFGLRGEGKWHGEPDIDPRNGNMYLIGFYNGQIVHYNIYTHQTKNLGAPVPGEGWPEHVWDWQRARLYGIGDADGKVLVYDTAHEKVIHQGLPVDSQTGRTFSWDSRARLLDRTTGDLYGTDAATHHLTRYDPTTNTFTIMHAALASRLRAWTDQKEANGSFWIFDDRGGIYKFYPAQDRAIYLRKNWGTTGWYTTFLERSPDGHYLYYSLSDTAISQGLPILQYDTRTNTVKVLAFLSDYYARHYHYQANKICGGALSADGQSLFVISNGNMVNGPRLPSLFHIHIPSLERA
ncbi:MAG TPA: hypothetical protein VL485_31095 [Ktedonobacteraceae bacterium]|nr:hypothetical protein [Ktedonobacteraceae bacterium]